MSNSKQENSLASVVVWLLASLFSSLQFFFQMSGNMMIGPVQSEFHLSKVMLGVFNASFFLTYVLVQIPAGMLYDRFQLRRVLLSAIMISVGSAIGFAYSHALWLAIVFRLLMGAGSGFAFVGMVYAANIGFSVRYFSMMVGFGEFVAMVGTAYAQSALPRVVLQSGWRHMVLLCAGFGVVITFLMWIFLRDQPSTTTEHAPLWSTLMGQLRQAAAIRGNWLCGLYCCAFFGVATGFVSLWGVPFLRHVHHFSYLEATNLMAWCLYGFAIGGPVIGYVGTGFKVRRTTACCGLIATVLLMTVILSPIGSLWSEKLLLFVTGALSCSYVLAFGMVQQITPSEFRGTAIGLCNMLALLGGVVYLPLTGWIVSEAAAWHLPVALQYELGLFILPLMMVLALIGLLFIGLPSSAAKES